MKLPSFVPLFLREIARDVAARRELSRLLVVAGKPPAGDAETLDALRTRYRDALAPPVAACEAYTNEPDDGTGFCDHCGNTETDHRGSP